MSELKPCPFCGEGGRLIEQRIGFAVQCVNRKCECAFTNWRNTIDEAVTEWNNRHQESEMQKEIDKLRNAIKHLVYEGSDGRIYTGLNGDSDVTEEIKHLIEVKE